MDKSVLKTLWIFKTVNNHTFILVVIQPNQSNDFLKQKNQPAAAAKRTCPKCSSDHPLRPIHYCAADFGDKRLHVLYTGQ